MDDQQQFCLRWNDFQTNMVASFKHLRDEKEPISYKYILDLI